MLTSHQSTCSTKQRSIIAVSAYPFFVAVVRDSFESESPSEYGPDGTAEEDGRSQKRNSHNKNGSDNSYDGFSSPSHRVDRGGSKQDRAKDSDGVERKVSGRSTSSHEEQRKKSESAGEDAARSHSTVVRRKQQDIIRFREGDRVSVFLGSAKGSEKGTILFSSSGGKYDVALDNGDVEKRVLPPDVSALRDDSEDDRRASLQGEGTNSRRGRDSGDDGSWIGRQEQPASESNSDSHTRLLKRRPQLDSVVSLSSHSNDKGTDDRKRPVSPVSSAPGSSVASVPATGGSGSPALPPSSTATSAAVMFLETTQSLLPSPAHVAVGKDSEEPYSARERESSSERGTVSPSSPSSTLRSKVRQAPGLLKTVGPCCTKSECF